MEKSIIFLTPSPPRIMWTILNLGKNWDLMTPPLGPNLGKNWNVDYFEIFAPLLILIKTAPKLFDPCENSTKILSKCYNGTISVIYQPYMYQIWPIFHLYITYILSKSRPDFSHLNLGKIWKSRPPPSSQNSLHFELWTFWFSTLTPPPPYGLFPNFVTFLIMTAPLSYVASIVVKRNRILRLNTDF